MENLILAFIISVAFAVTAIVSYKMGREKAFHSHFQAVRENYDLWMEAQKEAGVTEEQLEKITQFLAKRVVQEFKGLIQK